jgi:NitT/TauT family transport system substrate-binding protein
MEKLHIRFLRYSAFYTPLLLTMTPGHLDAEGLEATLDVVAPGRSIPDGIRDGSVQVAQSAVAVSFAPYLAGTPLPFVHFALLNDRDGFFLAGRAANASAAAPFDWRALEGRSIVADHFFQPMAMLRRALHLRGVDASRVRLLDAGDPAAIERAWRSGEGDFVHMQGPQPQQFEHEALGPVVASVGEVVGPVAFSSLCAAPAWIGTPAAAAFTRAFRRARREAHVQPAARTAEAVAGFLPGIDRPALVRAIATYQALGCWAGGIDITPALYEATLDVFEFSGDIAARPPFAEIIGQPPA